MGIAAQEVPQSTAAYAVEEGRIASKKYYQELDVTELVLGNGMKVLLKPTQEDGDEIQVRLLARGGYTSFSGATPAIADVAILTGIESGIGGLTSEQLSVYLYESSIDFLPKVEANCRTIDGSMPLEALDDYLTLINAYFTEHHFDQNEFARGIAAVNSALAEEEANAPTHQQISLFRAGVSKTNPDRSSFVKRVTPSQFALAKEINEVSFSNPADFFCVIVGDFSPDKIEASLSKYLGSIKAPTAVKQWSDPAPIVFPEGIVHKVIHTHERSDCVIRLTFPIDREMSPEMMPIFKLACRVVEKRLSQIALYDGSPAVSANIHDELPLYPSLNTVWMSIQFRCNHKDVESLVKNVVAQVRRLHDEGPFPSEVEEMRRVHEECRLSWMGSNEFWLMTMTNYSLWGADLELILHEQLPKGTAYESVKNFLQHSVRVDKYTTVSAVP